MAARNSRSNGTSAATRTLIIANTVPRARQIYSALQGKVSAGDSAPFAVPARRSRSDCRGDCLMSHRPEGQIVVATQVLEAGIDITSALLVTDIAPWGSMVQRFGRVNRYGDDVCSEIWWVDEPGYENRRMRLRRTRAEEIDHAMGHLAKLTEIGKPLVRPVRLEKV